MSIVRNVHDQCGIEAWRRVAKRFGGKTRGRPVYLTRRCTAPVNVKRLTDVPSSVEKLEQDIRQLGADYGERMSDSLMTGIIQEMMPPGVAEFMVQ